MKFIDKNHKYKCVTFQILFSHAIHVYWMYTLCTRDQSKSGTTQNNNKADIIAAFLEIQLEGKPKNGHVIPGLASIWGKNQECHKST